MTEIIFEKMSFDVTFLFDPYVQSVHMEEAGFMTYIAASHQVVIDRL